ncbi:MAG: hypothetical protein BHW57_08510 [Azospirillum sp. 47_25]|nr:MAG: hypothetical protein BHW57_08510 [Azospirillum sp. 47_25]
MWPKIRQSKIIPVGFYFVAGILAGRLKQKADLVPGIFIQGYRPHSSNGLFSSEKRGYGALLVKPESDVKMAPDDLVLCEANVYQMKEDDRFELVLMNSEWRHPEAVKQFMVRLRQEHRLEEISDVKKCVYHCDKSRGYFLAGRDYEVWSQLVGLVENTQGLSKKVLVVDYNCGIPCVVDFKEENFELVD